jgi:hypothetical protein
MIAPLIVNETALEGVYCVQHSAFLIEEEEIPNPFSFSDITDIFKKKDSNTGASSSSSNSGSSTTSEKGSGIGSGIFAGLAGLLGIAGAIAPVLPAIGIGSKSRIAETNATAAANTQIYNAQTQSTLATIKAEDEKSKETEKLVLIVFVAVLIIVVVAGVLFTGKRQ